MDNEHPNSEESIARWTRRHRHKAYRTRKNEEIHFIDLGTGSPQWTPFKPALEMAHKTLERADVMSSYHNTQGTFSDASYPDFFYRKGIYAPGGKKLTRANFLPGNGATQLYAAAVQSVLKKDDVLLVPVPTYGFFLEPGNLKNKRVEPLLLNPQNNFRLTPEQLDGEITRINQKLAAEDPPKRVTAFLHINPHNPTGAVYDKKEVEALAAVIKKHDLRLVIDDLAYSDLEYGQNHEETGPKQFNRRIAYPMAAVEGMFDKTLSLMSLSKAYSVVDLRAGLACGPEPFIAAMRRNIGRNIEFSSSIAQIALCAVFNKENNNAREEYLSEHAAFLAKHYLRLRVLINGWDNDKEAAEFWGSKDAFLSQTSSFGRVKEDAIFEDRLSSKGFIDAIKKQEERIQKTLAKYIPKSMRYLLKSEDDIKVGKQWFEGEQTRQKRYAQLVEHGIPGIKTINSAESGFFLLLDATALKGKYIGKKQINNATDFTRALSYNQGVYLIPGTAMGYTGDQLLLRLSFPEGSTAGDEMLTGLERIREFTQMLKDHPGPLRSQEARSR